ncbi:hypothetical protein HRQ91_06295 [Treponema parvum]|uniref:Lipoprotein n=1 Tax=Treponema parvum TaxID=138851 RepID=A0A975IF96_9SPIR|nr:hypothetical protein [Treponema parvum]QTQ14099.1 hypothetical protein HRQ91_06295 [Treponema parvum]
MINPKVIVGSAMVGFFLSCFVGFLCRAGIPVILLRAFIFALVFGALGFGANFVAGKFLFAPDADVSMSDVSEKFASAQRASGGTIDITIADEELPSEENSTDFTVTKAVRAYHDTNNGRKNSLSQAQTSEAAAVVNSAAERSPETSSGKAPNKSSSAAPDASEIVPFHEENAPVNDKDDKDESKSGSLQGFLFGMEGKKDGYSKPEGEVKESSGLDKAEDKSASQPAENQSVSERSEENSGGIDDLPDLGNFVADEQGEGTYTVTDNSDFSSPVSAGSVGSSGSSKQSRSSSITDMNDSEVIAKAIRTVIANDN